MCNVEIDDQTLKDPYNVRQDEQRLPDGAQSRILAGVLYEITYVLRPSVSLFF